MFFKVRRDLPMMTINISAIVVLIILLFVMFEWRHASPLILPMLAVYVILIALIIYRFVYTNFVFDDQHLTCQVGPRSIKFEYKNMKSIDYSRGLKYMPRNNFMGAFDGFIIHLHYEAMSIRLSPERQDEFIQELFKKAPQLAYCSIEEQRAKCERQAQLEQQEVVLIPYIGDTVKGSKVGSSSSEWLKF